MGRADDGWESSRLIRRESVNDDIFNPVVMLTRTAAIFVPIARPWWLVCRDYVGKTKNIVFLLYLFHRHTVRLDRNRHDLGGFAGGPVAMVRHD